MRPWALLAVVMTLATGCDLTVNNPNNLLESELDNPAVATSLANGAEATVTRALGAMLGPYSTATDELTWIGSRQGWQELDEGGVDNPLNEFSDAAFPYVAEARWTADEAIRRLERFQAQRQLATPADLVWAYLMGAIIYTAIADMFDDFVLGDRQEPKPPVGKANMPTLYDKAIEYTSKALALAQQLGNRDLQRAALALRARARFSKALWTKARNPGSSPLVSDAGADQDAQAALALIGNEDYAFRLVLSSASPALIDGNVTFTSNINSRFEIRVGNSYIVPTADNRRVASIRLRDPIDNVPDPKLTAEINALVAGGIYGTITVASAREMRLILAESALAKGDEAGFRTHINAIRALDRLSPYTGQIPALTLLRHMRRVNLFLQGRRLADHYRFGEPSPEWTARAKPGVFFPITIIERRANPYVR
ncbi:MAG: hypothetical protein N2561_02695 [Bacteroidetes bacterium]|nr:hypothetical protein [Rhodothermia bacterium]MCS7155569.1 hypothetical protein [Bacteroidota bacterium]MCX7906427.1 hypothetical protein [Bacteroidota bacterium]MDW8137291.1 hypothetical protein [Bacteroidota bacterium]MDW8284839.1 hypothetical protein [Bacteroidota bacterium]